jgi:endonuclease G, mitochondrial
MELKRGVVRHDGTHPNAVQCRRRTARALLSRHARRLHRKRFRSRTLRSEERTRTVADNTATFFTTNILPQKPDLNQGVWNDFEKYCEELCKRNNKELFVVAGGTFEKNYRVIGKGVAVPKSTWKIVVVLERGQSVKDITANTRVIAIDMPNIDGVRYDKWQKYKTTVRDLEKSTGYDFLSALPKALQDALETKLDNE